MKKFLIATSLLSLAAIPAQAQLLGGGGITGGLGSTLDLSGTISRTTETVRGTTQGTISGSAQTRGEQSVDRRSGRVKANRSANADGSANVTQMVDTPILPMGAAASGNGNASGEGSAEAQLIGTDALRSASGSAIGQARGTLASANGLASPAAGNLLNASPSPAGGVPAAGGTASGSGSASGNGSAGLMSMPLAVAGTAAGMANGAAIISPGMPVVSPLGLPIGKVSQIFANSRGEVEQILVSNGDAIHTIPAGNLAASGNALVAAEGSGAATEKQTSGTSPAGEAR